MKAIHPPKNKQKKTKNECLREDPLFSYIQSVESFKHIFIEFSDILDNIYARAECLQKVIVDFDFLCIDNIEFEPILFTATDDNVNTNLGDYCSYARADWGLDNIHSEKELCGFSYFEHRQSNVDIYILDSGNYHTCEILFVLFHCLCLLMNSSLCERIFCENKTKKTKTRQIKKKEQKTLKKKIKKKKIGKGVKQNHREFSTTKVESIDVGSNTGKLYGDHGTHVAGIAGGSTVGASRHFPIYSATICTDQGCSISHIAKALEWIQQRILIQKRKGVINMSISGLTSSYVTKFYDNYCQAFAELGVICVAAAGNQGHDASNYAPGCSDWIITVGAIDEDGEETSFSNYGKSVNIHAPGVEIKSSVISNSYSDMSGTSQATPYVSGIIANMLQLNPSLTFNQIKANLIENGNTVQGCRGGGVCKAIKWDCDCALQNGLCHRTEDLCTFWEKHGVVVIISICVFVFCYIPILYFIYKKRKQNKQSNNQSTMNYQPPIQTKKKNKKAKIRYADIEDYTYH